jgi:hypothetical protein
MTPERILSFDFETANHSAVSICAAGVAIIENGQLVGTRHWLVRPPQGHGWFREDFIGIHGITHEDVMDAPEFPTVAGELLPLLSRSSRRPQPRLRRYRDGKIPRDSRTSAPKHEKMDHERDYYCAQQGACSAQIPCSRTGFPMERPGTLRKTPSGQIFASPTSQQDQRKTQPPHQRNHQLYPAIRLNKTAWFCNKSEYTSIVRSEMKTSI